MKEFGRFVSFTLAVGLLASGCGYRPEQETQKSTGVSDDGRYRSVSVLKRRRGGILDEVKGYTIRYDEKNPNLLRVSGINQELGVEEISETCSVRFKSPGGPLEDYSTVVSVSDGFGCFNNLENPK